MPGRHRRNPQRSRLVSRTIYSGRHITGLSLEPELWEGFDEIRAANQLSRSELVRQIQNSAPDTKRTSAVRVFIIQYFRLRSELRNCHSGVGEVPLPRRTR